MKLPKPDSTEGVIQIPLNSENTPLIGDVTVNSESHGNHQCLHVMEKKASDMTHGVEQGLPADLQSFKGDLFTEALQAQHNSSIQSSSFNQQQQQQQQSQFIRNSTNAEVLQSFSAQLAQSTKNYSENLQVVTEEGRQNDAFSHSSNMPSFQGLLSRDSRMQESSEYNIDKSSVLERLLTREQQGLDTSFQTNSPPTSKSSPEFPQGSPTSSASSPYADTQNSSFMDTSPTNPSYGELNPVTSFPDTQSSLINNAEKLRLDSLTADNNDEDLKQLFAWDVTKIDNEIEHIEMSKTKMAKMFHETDSASDPSVERVFDADGATQDVSADFKFSKFGQSDPDQQLFHFGSDSELQSENSPPTGRVPNSPFKTPHPPHAMSRKREQARRAKEPLLSQQFPAKVAGYELRILNQPEEQHRARYLTEGSRGSVKNRNGQAYPMVKLFGQVQEATLQVFIGCDSGRVRPHGFYQACKVCGKNSTSCVEKDIDGTTVIEIEMKANNDMTASIDCVGILKLRNADVEQRIGIAKAKKKSTKARMVFRVTFRKACGNPQILQVASSPILCTQPIGQPEICKMSLRECPVTGAEELYIIGKNFLRGTQVFFQEVSEEDTTKTLWEKEGEIDKDFFQATHLIVTVPEYGRTLLQGAKVNCQVVVHSGGKISEAQQFTYKQVDQTGVVVKQETPMDTSEESRKRNYPFVAPEALELNNQIQQTQQGSKTPEVFQLPPGLISGVMSQADSSFTPMEGTSTHLDGPGTYPAQTSPVSVESFTPTSAEEALTIDNFSLTKTTLGQDIMDMTQTQTWDSENLNNATNQGTENNLSKIENKDIEYPVLSNEYDDTSLEICASRTKNPRLSTDMDLDQGITHNSEVSVTDLLKNIAYSLNQKPALVNNGVAQSFSFSQPHVSTILTQSTNRMISSSVPSGPANPTPSLQDKPVTPVDNSILKGVLTCPESSLENLNFEPFLAARRTTSTDENEAVAMETKSIPKEKPVKLNFTRGKELSNITTIDLTQDPIVAFSPDQVVPGQCLDKPFSPSEVLVSLSQMSTDTTLTSHTMSQTDQPLNPVRPQSPASVQPSNSIQQTNSSAYIQDQLSKLIASSNTDQITALSQQSFTPVNNMVEQYQHEQQNGQNLNSHPQSPSDTVSPINQQHTTFLQTADTSFIQSQQEPVLVHQQVLQNQSYSQQQIANQPLDNSHGLNSTLPSLQSQGVTASQDLAAASQQVLQYLGLNMSQNNQQALPKEALLHNSVLQSLRAQIGASTVQQTPAPSTTVDSVGQTLSYTSIAGDASGGSPQSPQVSHTRLIEQLLLNQIAQKQQLQQQQQQQQQQLQQQQQIVSPPTQPSTPQPSGVLQAPQPVAPSQSVGSVAPAPGIPDLPNAPVSNTTSNAVPVPSSSGSPLATQIIICNPSSQQSMPNNVVPQFGAAPSIFIVPGQTGPNGQVENLLRSILGSMIPQSQPAVLTQAPQTQATPQAEQQQPPQ